MPDIIDLGGAPAEADCAQLGQTTNFAAVNSFEVEAYRLAIITRYSAPPQGCRLTEARRMAGVTPTLDLPAVEP